MNKLLVIALAGLCVGAHAASGSAALDNVTFTLSAQPGYSVTPTLEFEPGAGSPGAPGVLFSDLATHDLFGYMGTNGNFWRDPVAYDFSFSGGAGHADVTSTGWHANANAADGFSFLATSPSAIQWAELSPHSVLTISGSVSLSATALGCAALCDYASAFVSLRAHVLPTQSTALPGDDIKTWLLQSYGSAPAALNKIDTFVMHLVNDSDQTEYVYMDQQLQTSGHGMPVAVPEPQTYALLLAGLAAITLVRRRARG